jgi:hypothetical protein
MLASLRGKASDRKLRLFGVACCRQAQHVFVEELSQAAIAASERHADGLTSAEEMALAAEEANRLPSLKWFQLVDRSEGGRGAWQREAISVAVAIASPSIDIPSMCLLTRDILRAVQMNPYSWDSWFGWGRVRRRQADLLRHIMGNPFKPYQPPAHWPSSTVPLAEALYAGEGVSFALADALEEGGHSDLAEHFREPAHPKGCWALDAIVGKR